MTRSFALVIGACCLLGCGGGAGDPDAGGSDARVTTDAGVTPDSSTPTDAGSDASTPRDGGANDAGANDAGANDGGANDAGAVMSELDAGPPSCGGFGGARCKGDRFCQYTGTACGADDGSGLCLPRPGDCDATVDRVCGCDLHTYLNACLAHAAGTDVFLAGPCDVCVPMDAAVSGDCATTLGVSWNGAACEPMVGCSCTGTDCGGLYTSASDCITAHYGCFPPCGGPPAWGLACEGDRWCDYSDLDVCGRAGSTGICLPRPSGCTSDAPVCGCDNVTYPNACAAEAAGVDILDTSACPEPPA